MAKPITAVGCAFTRFPNFRSSKQEARTRTKQAFGFGFGLGLSLATGGEHGRRKKRCFSRAAVLSFAALGEPQMRGTIDAAYLRPGRCGLARGFFRRGLGAPVNLTTNSPDTGSLTPSPAPRASRSLRNVSRISIIFGRASMSFWRLVHSPTMQ